MMAQSSTKHSFLLTVWLRDVTSHVRCMCGHVWEQFLSPRASFPRSPPYSPEHFCFTKLTSRVPITNIIYWQLVVIYIKYWLCSVVFRISPAVFRLNKSILQNSKL